MTIYIDTGVPLPPPPANGHNGNTRRIDEALDALKVGQSFALPGDIWPGKTSLTEEAANDKRRSRLCMQVSFYKKRLENKGKLFTCRKVIERGIHTVRCWRVA